MCGGMKCGHDSGVVIEVYYKKSLKIIYLKLLAKRMEQGKYLTNI